MQARSVVAEMFIGIPTHFWVLPVAGLVAFYGLKWSGKAAGRAKAIQVITYALLIALAVVPNGIYALLPPAPGPEQLMNQQPLPNYAGRFYLDAFYVFGGWALSKVVKLRFR